MIIGNLIIDLCGDSSYCISGDINLLLESYRSKGILLGYGYIIEKDSVIIKFTEENKISILEMINVLAERSKLSVNLSENLDNMLGNYRRDQENFLEFSNNARKIRENKLEESPGLLNDFREFQKILLDHMDLNRKLTKLQMLSAFHMAYSQNSCNFSVPGAGKTSIVYGAYCYLKSLDKNHAKYVDKLLVIGPLSSFAPWEFEYEQCFGISPDSQRLSGDSSISKSDKLNHLYSTSPKELTLMSHSGLKFHKSDIISFLKKNKVLVVVDEAHRIKNVHGIWGKSAVEISKEATSRVVLSGTPSPNGYEDLYNLYKFIYPNNHKKILGFHYKNLQELTQLGLTIKNKRVKVFVENIKPFFLRINKKELSLPPITESVMNVEMDRAHRKIYDFVFSKYLPDFQDYKSHAKRFINKAKIIRMRQAATNPKLLAKPLRESMENFEECIDPNIMLIESHDEVISDYEILSDIENYSKNYIPQKFIQAKILYEEKIRPVNGKVIIWTIFIQNAEDFQNYLKDSGIDSRLLIGKIPQIDREHIIKKFNDPKNDEFNVIIANPFAVSESISLHQGCHNAIYMERDYNAANFLQSKDRIHRLGLQNDVITNYYYLVSENSIDEEIFEKLDKKVKLMEEIIDQDIPLFHSLGDNDETEIITALVENHVRKI